MKKNAGKSMFLFCASLWLMISQSAFAAPNLREVAILDLNGRTGIDEPVSNLHGAQHVLSVAGMPFVTTVDINEACRYAMVVIAARLGDSVLQPGERDALRQYVFAGGVLLTQRLADSALYQVFGVSGYQPLDTRFNLHWSVEGKDATLRWFDDPLEKTLQLGQQSHFPHIFWTSGFTLAGGEELARFDDDSAAVVRNAFGQGWAYTLGFSFRDFVMMNLLNHDYMAEHKSSNGFDPATDVVCLFLRAVYEHHVPFATWKHTSPSGSTATLIITHDVDAQSAFVMMNQFAEQERAHNISATYNITTSYTRYMREGTNWGGFYTEENINKLRQLTDKGAKIGSHSVNHFPDFNDETIALEGAPGNTRENYLATYDGKRSWNATVYGELEVSKNLLESDLGIKVRSFRSGHLCWNNYMTRVQQNLGYWYDSSFSANEIVTNFPFRCTRNRLPEGELSSIYEIPMTLSDVYSIEPINETNFRKKVQNWLDVTTRNSANHAPTVLLIHPNRDFKIAAQESLLNQLPAGMAVVDFDSFGDFWRARDAFSFRTVLEGRKLIVIVPDSSLPVEGRQGIVICGGQRLAAVEMRKENGQVLPISSQSWSADDLLLSWGVKLTASRMMERSWSIRFQVTQLQVSLSAQLAASGVGCTIFRKTDNSDYQPVLELGSSSLNSGTATVYDVVPASGAQYTYQARLYSSDGTLLTVSSEETI